MSFCSDNINISLTFKECLLLSFGFCGIQFFLSLQLNLQVTEKLALVYNSFKYLKHATTPKVINRKNNSTNFTRLMS